uniref:Cytochrome c oxidase subunit 3 n=1 Tax=Calisoga longitarsis TaxID=394809 RepID=B2CKU9_9ARAC|nr:cytochrome oxidase subunit 3 [Calisoga longitarsis]
MENLFHPYHLVTISPWPVVMGVVVLIVIVGVVKMMFLSSYALFFFGLVVSGLVVSMWWRDVIRESTYEGSHVSVVVSGLMVGMVLFIVSEVFFFVSFFWTFFHSSLVPVMDLGGVWPPSGVESFNPFQIPLLNTIILLSSGVSVTWAHQCLLVGDTDALGRSLMMTWMLGIYFLMLQLFEYFSATFSISDSVFGSVFFVATGFHGLHVMIGTVFLIVVWVRAVSLHFSESHHFGFEASAWYWHFVDVVWLFLFSVVYWWGG